jgi:hypothetical protein
MFWSAAWYLRTEAVQNIDAGRTLDGTAMSVITGVRVIAQERRDVLVITVWKIGAK